MNFDAEQAVRFLQIAVQLETRDPATIELLKTNDPVVRNDLLLLFANQKYAQLSTREGKEALRAGALEAVRKVLTSAGGHPERLEAFKKKGSALVGDVHPGAAEVAGALTPVPGGVGLLTIAMLMSNTVKAARLRRGAGRAAGATQTAGVARS